MQEIARLAGGNRAFAKKIGITESRLYRFLSGETAPDAEVIASISEHLDISPRWLVTGKGDIRHAQSQQRAPTPLDAALLRLVVECVEEWSKERRPAVAKKAEIIGKVYAFFASEPGKADRGKVLALVRAAA
ncbi:MAG TPA: helix-turn-helix transcriptional regulator [Candidatus Binataceae bacterium]|nr:helix-turn-helix transcriptional regulator [Candidatus Binataceae bacterium]